MTSIAFRYGWIVLSCIAWIWPVSASAADWPTWRYDANRSAASPAELPVELYLQWTRKYPPLKPAWAEDARLYFDATYEPIVVGKRLFLNSSHDDSVTAIDTDTGEEEWRFIAGGPVRFAPVASKGKLYFGADDGWFYCLSAADGTLVWKFRAAPSDRKVIGNERLISVWPVRGGPVLADGKIYFTVGVWPFEGTFLYTLNAETGRSVPGRGGVASQPTRYSTLLSNDLSPQGYLTVSGNRLFLPLGRSPAISMDRRTGKFVKLNYSSRGRTDCHVTALGSWLFHGDKVFDVDSASLTSVTIPRPVLTDEAIYCAAGGVILAYDARNPRFTASKDRRGQPVKKMGLVQLWRLANDQIIDVPASNYERWLEENPLWIDIKSGSRLYGHQGSTVFAINVSTSERVAHVNWKSTVEGTPATMLSADDKLFVVTREGRIYCFGAELKKPKRYPAPRPRFAAASDDWSRKVGKILDSTNVSDGYCLAFGAGSGRLIEELLRQSNLHIIAVDPDAEKVGDLRRKFDAAGLYGARVTVYAGDPLNFGLPPYLASLIVSESLDAAGFDQGQRFATTIFHSLRPYGGTACLQIPSTSHDEFVELVHQTQFAKAEVKRDGKLTTFSRVGALPGSGDWTHEYADSANSLMSQDTLVRAPLGVLWFGGPASSSELFYDRHYWGPSLAVVDGRMFIQGPGKLTAVDVYTGRVLWQIPLRVRKKMSAGRRGTDFDQILAGFNFVAVSDGIYLARRRTLYRFDPVTGKTLSEFEVPSVTDEWGRMRIWEDLMFVPVFRGVKGRGNQPVQIIAMNRYSGRVVWSKETDLSFPLFAVDDGKVFCFDGMLAGLYRAWARKGLLPEARAERYLVALDARTGTQIWREPTEMVVTWLAYSKSHDVLVISNKKGVAAYQGRDGKKLWNKQSEGRGFLGHSENLWDKVILWKDRIIDQRGPGMAYAIRTGKPIMQRHPLTHEPVPWEFTKSGSHCNYVVANEHLLTFRAQQGGFCEIASCNTGRLPGFRSGCRNSLIPAGGVLNSPNFAYGCICDYSLFTSLALVHVPDVEMWGYNAYQPRDGRLQRLGINLGASGDRFAANGTLWLDYPSVGGTSPDVSVKMTAENPRWFRYHSLQIQGDDLKWVAASGVEGLSSITVPLAKTAVGNQTYTVRLHFIEPDALYPGQRVLRVAMQGKEVLGEFDIVKEAKGPRRAVIKEFHGIEATSALKISLTARSGRPLLCGVEVVSE